MPSWTPGSCGPGRSSRSGSSSVSAVGAAGVLGREGRALGRGRLVGEDRAVGRPGVVDPLARGGDPRPVRPLVDHRLGGQAGVALVGGGRGRGGVAAGALGLVAGAGVGRGVLGGALLGGGHVVADRPGALDVGAEPGGHRVPLGHGDGAPGLVAAGGGRVGLGQRGVATRTGLLGLAADHAGVALPGLVSTVGLLSVAVHRDLLSVNSRVSVRGGVQTPGAGLGAAQRKSRDRVGAASGRGRSWSAITLITPSARSSRPLISRAGADLPTRR